MDADSVMRSPAYVVLIGLIALVWSGCESCERSITRDSRAPAGDILVTDEHGARHLVQRAKIPAHLQVHCDVCPELCTQVDLRPQPVDQVIATYRENVAVYQHERGPRLAAAVERLDHMACLVAASGPPLRTRFLALLEDDDRYTRFAAAVHALHHDLDVPGARTVLERMGREMDERGEPTDLAHDARFLLMEHEIGNDLVLP